MNMIKPVIRQGLTAEYRKVHARIQRIKGKPEICSACGKKSRLINWANVDHKYSENLDDYIALCIKCHTRRDKKMTKTDNSHFVEKVKLRLENLPDKKIINVLEMYGGRKRLWRSVKKETEKNIKVLSIEKKQYPGVYLRGDNRKFNIDFSIFDIIDIDAYGAPWGNLLRVLSEGKSGTMVFLTWIQSVLGMLPHDFLIEYGFSRQMITKCPTLFCKNGKEKLHAVLARHGVEMIKSYSTKDGRKNYLSFILPGA